MIWKEVLKKNMSNANKMTALRFKSAKLLFILGSFLFFINFFFVGANFYPDFFQPTLPYTYLLFGFSICILIFYFFREKVLKTKAIGYSIGLGALLLLLNIIILLPIFFEGGIFYFLIL